MIAKWNLLLKIIPLIYPSIMTTHHQIHFTHPRGKSTVGKNRTRLWHCRHYYISHFACDNDFSKFHVHAFSWPHEAISMPSDVYNI